MKQHLRMRAAVLVDHLFFLYIDLFFRDREVKVGPYLREDRFDGSRSAVRDPERFFSPVRTPARFEVRHEWKWEGTTVQHLCFDSPVRTGCDRNDVVHLRRYRRDGGPPRPTIVFSLPYRLTNYAPFDRYAERMVREGFDAILFQPPYHLDRRSRRGMPGEGVVGANFRRSFQAIRQGFKDLSTVLVTLRAEGVPRVGFFGMSMGSLLAGHVVCSDPEVDFAILTAPACAPDTILLQSEILRRLRRNLDRLGVERDRAASLWGAVRLDRRRPAIPTERILILAPIHDQVVPLHEFERLHEAWGRPPIRRLEHGHISVLAEPRLMEISLEHLRTIGALPGR